MLYIKKGRPSQKTANEVIKIRHSNEWKKVEADDTKAIREIFDRLDKKELRKTILDEQRHICGYCMRQIKNEGTSMTVEHIVPLSVNKEKALDYENMIGVCHGGRKSKRKTECRWKPNFRYSYAACRGKTDGIP